MPSFLPWLLETPQAGDKGFGKSPPRDVLLCLKWGRKISLQPLAGGFEVPGTQCPAPSPLSPPPMEELESRVPSFINHTRTQNFFFFLHSTFFLLQKLQGSDVFVPTVGVRGAPHHSRVGETPKVPVAACGPHTPGPTQSGKVFGKVQPLPRAPSPAPSRQGLSRVCSAADTDTGAQGLGRWDMGREVTPQESWGGGRRAAWREERQGGGVGLSRGPGSKGGTLETTWEERVSADRGERG